MPEPTAESFDLIGYATEVEADNSSRYAPSAEVLLQEKWPEFERNLVGIRDRLSEAKDQGQHVTIILGCGGTFQSKKTERGYEPIGTLKESMEALQLPKDDTHHLELFDLMNLDSSQMRPEHWGFVARAVDKLYQEVRDLTDSIIVTHGTDTMDRGGAYLSFGLQGMKLPIILTGSQKPAFEHGGDAKDQMGRALITARLAAIEDINEVMVLCGTKVTRATWAIKQGDTTTNAFGPWNDPRQGHDGADYERAWQEGRFAELTPAFVDFGLGKPTGDLTFAGHALRRHQLGRYELFTDFLEASDIYPAVMSDKRPKGLAEHIIGQQVVALVELGSSTADDRLVDVAMAAADRGKAILRVAPFFDSIVQAGTYAAGSGIARGVEGVNRPLPIVNTSPRTLEAKTNFALASLGLSEAFTEPEGLGPILSEDDLKRFYDLMETNLVGELVGTR